MKSLKYKIRPSQAIEAIFEQWLDICRELYNAGLQERRDAYQKQGISINFAIQCAQLPEIKESRLDIAQVNAQVLQQVLRRLSRSFDNFFRRVRNGEKPGFPRFKSSRSFSSFIFPQAKGTFRLDGDKLHLSKIGSVRLRLSRPIEGTIKTCTIKREADGWYVSFAVEENQSRFFPKTGQTTGVDVGIENFAALTNGEMIENPKYLREAERRLKTAQRKVSRRKNKRSNRRRKAIKLLAKQHLKVKRQRLDFHHKESLKLIKQFDQITFEDLNIVGMLKNHHLAKSIVDAGWNSFITITENKAENAGRKFVKVSARFTSQDCSHCGNRVKKSLSEREHRCIACGLVMHRDTNSAVIIDQKGRAGPSVMGTVALPDDPRISIHSR